MRYYFFSEILSAKLWPIFFYLVFICFILSYRNILYMDNNLLSVTCCKYLLLDGFSFILVMVSWWLEILYFNEVKCKYCIWIHNKNVFFIFLKSFKTVNFIFNPESIWNYFLSRIYSSDPPTPCTNITVSMDNVWTDPVIYKTTSVLCPNHINACIQFPDQPLFSMSQYMYSALI